MMAKIAAICFAITMAGTLQAMALASWFPGKNGRGPNVSHSAPGPVAGVGLPLVLVIGGYIWYRKRLKK